MAAPFTPVLRLSRLLLRAAVVACLLLAAVLLSADAAEYPGRSAAGLRALARGPLPLLALAALHLALLPPDVPASGRPRAPLLAAALASDLLAFLLGARLLLRPGAPPFPAILAGVALLLLGATAALAWVSRRRPMAAI